MHKTNDAPESETFRMGRTTYQLWLFITAFVATGLVIASLIVADANRLPRRPAMALGALLGGALLYTYCTFGKRFLTRRILVVGDDELKIKVDTDVQDTIPMKDISFIGWTSDPRIKLHFGQLGAGGLGAFASDDDDLLIYDKTDRLRLRVALTEIYDHRQAKTSLDNFCSRWQLQT